MLWIFVPTSQLLLPNDSLLLKVLMAAKSFLLPLSGDRPMSGMKPIAAGFRIRPEVGTLPEASSHPGGENRSIDNKGNSIHWILTENSGNT